MKNDQQADGITQIDNSLMGFWSWKDGSALTGICHLTFDNAWRCAFVSDECLKILDCTREDFLQVLCGRPIASVARKAATLGNTILDELAQAPGERRCTGARRSGGARGFRGRFRSVRDRDGRMQIYGQLVEAEDARALPGEPLEISNRLSNLIEQSQAVDIARQSSRIIKQIQEEYHALLHYMDDMEVTVLEAELNSGAFRLIYNSNPDYTVKMPESPFEEFAQFFGVEQIHPEDREQYMQEIQFCHGPFFGQGQRRHSIFSRMYRPTTREYQLHEFVTLRMNMEDADCRDVILICRPLKDEKGGAGRMAGDNALLESNAPHHILGRTLRCRDDEDLSMTGGIGYLCELTGFAPEELRDNFGGRLLELICPEEREKTMRALREQLSGGDTAEMEFAIRAKDGRKIWLLGSCIRVPGESGEGFLYCLFMESTRIRQEQEAEHRKLQERIEQADYDAITGLLRRDIGELRIRKILSSGERPGSVLMILDLDDLKSINDSLGHAYGDRAIIAIANELKGHFGREDILIRSGGDEFMVFLPGAGMEAGDVRRSVEELLQKLSTCFIGDKHDRMIHCSIGCAVEMPEGDSFDWLYQRADLALYHVKRSGKNNFAFFDPAMQEDGYRLRINQAAPVINEAASAEELKHLLAVVSAVYPGVILFNLTQNYFRILTVGSNIESVQPPDRVDVFWENWRANVHPDDVDAVFAALSRNGLLSLYAQGRRSLRHHYRNLESTGYMDTEVSVRLHTSDSGDIYAFLFFRWETEAEKDGNAQ